MMAPLPLLAIVESARWKFVASLEVKAWNTSLAMPASGYEQVLLHLYPKCPWLVRYVLARWSSVRRRVG